MSSIATTTIDAAACLNCQLLFPKLAIRQSPMLLHMLCCVEVI